MSHYGTPTSINTNNCIKLPREIIDTTISIVNLGRSSLDNCRTILTLSPNHWHNHGIYDSIVHHGYLFITLLFLFSEFNVCFVLSFLVILRHTQERNFLLDVMVACPRTKKSIQHLVPPLTLTINHTLFPKKSHVY